MKMLQFGTQQVSIDRDDQRPNPHTNKQVSKGFFRTTLGTGGTKTGSKQSNAEWTPHVPLLPDFFVISLTRHGDFDFVQNVVQISFLHDSLYGYNGINDGLIESVDLTLVRRTAKTLELGFLYLFVEGNWVVHDGFYIQKFIIFKTLDMVPAFKVYDSNLPPLFLRRSNSTNESTKNHFSI
jgi:hypothetical protein